ncbi:MauE/DoxX family redox-associated membrane protein [Sphingobacterium faecale]|uniref:Methylamine utilisation protein MauE domain-containing protein n=1 Tax=Sphingobacterium faecale TaxID=2803775 RepID=A0ABS1R4R6_9SPHI|nr:MauE/DoxX family redox-associated membrane protein [Sphingobacterium faecale]MBL1408997.1 hypothetical protein [Sphingobacterium faecale]
MKKKTTHITLYSVRIFLMVFWLYVALDKLWDLPQFHSALLRQPFPDGWADILFWLLPLTELVLAVLFITTYHPNSRHSAERSDLGISNLSIRLPYILSALLLAIFSVYIALGILHLYEERPCGCASVFRGLSWSWHLLLNCSLLGISILGWYLTGPTAPMERYIQSKRQVTLFLQYLEIITTAVYSVTWCCFLVFKMRFAPFPGRPVLQ